jgi:hypothetical protein
MGYGARQVWTFSNDITTLQLNLVGDSPIV